jgi:MFS family permease
VIGEALTRRRAGRRAWTPGLNRFALANSLSAAGDALVTVSLAGSLFFRISPQASQQQVLVYLFITLTPFVVLAPFIGPAIDRLRGADRWLVAGLFALRGGFAVALAFMLYSLAFYFFALAVLVASRASSVTKQAIVPGLVAGPSDLVAANARLARLSTIVGGIGGAVGAVVVAKISPEVNLFLAAVVFLVAAALATRLPPIKALHPGLSEADVEQVEYRTVHTGVVVSSSWAYTVMRVAVGFFVFGTAFALRRESEPPWMYGLAAAGYGAGVFLGNAFVPHLRERYREDRMIVGSIIALAVVGAFGALGPSRFLVLTFSVVLGVAVGVGRQAFEALVQSRAPVAAQGRAFARFETWFQLGWVAGAILATAVGIPIRYSLAVLAVAMVVTAWFYDRAVGAARRAAQDEPFNAVEVARHRLGSAAEWRQLDRPRIAITELVSAVDLARAAGVRVDPQLVACLDRLRHAAFNGEPVDAERLKWAMHQAQLVVADAETTGQSVATSDVDVTDKPSARASIVTTRGERSDSDR